MNIDSILLQAQSPLSLSHTLFSQRRGWEMSSWFDCSHTRSEASLSVFVVFWNVDLKLASRAFIFGDCRLRHFWGGQDDHGRHPQGEGEFVLRLLNSMQRAHIPCSVFSCSMQAIWFHIIDSPCMSFQFQWQFLFCFCLFLDLRAEGGDPLWWLREEGYKGPQQDWR